MKDVVLGKIAPAAPGTPVPIVADSNRNDPTKAIMCHQILVSQIAGATGNQYFGKTGLKRAADAQPFTAVIKQFMPSAASGFLDNFAWPPDPPDGNTLYVTDYLVDADNASQGLLVTLVVV